MKDSTFRRFYPALTTPEADGLSLVDTGALARLAETHMDNGVHALVAL